MEHAVEFSGYVLDQDSAHALAVALAAWGLVVMTNDAGDGTTLILMAETHRGSAVRLAMTLASVPST